jgi:hypothetical protein
MARSADARRTEAPGHHVGRPGAEKATPTCGNERRSISIATRAAARGCLPACVRNTRSVVARCSRRMQETGTRTEGSKARAAVAPRRAPTRTPPIDPHFAPTCAGCPRERTTRRRSVCWVGECSRRAVDGGGEAADLLAPARIALLSDRPAVAFDSQVQLAPVAFALESSGRVNLSVNGPGERMRSLRRLDAIAVEAEPSPGEGAKGLADFGDAHINARRGAVLSIPLDARDHTRSDPGQPTGRLLRPHEPSTIVTSLRADVQRAVL